MKSLTVQRFAIFMLKTPENIETIRLSPFRKVLNSKNSPARSEFEYPWVKPTE